MGYLGGADQVFLGRVSIAGCAAFRHACAEGRSVFGHCVDAKAMSETEQLYLCNCKHAQMARRCIPVAKYACKSSKPNRFDADFWQG